MYKLLAEPIALSFLISMQSGCLQIVLLAEPVSSGNPDVNALLLNVLLAEPSATCGCWEGLLHAERWDSASVCADARVVSS